MSYQTEFQVAANSLGENVYCHICRKDFIVTKMPKYCYQDYNYIQPYDTEWPRNKVKHLVEGQFIAVWRPTPGNVAMVTPTTIQKMSATVTDSPLFAKLSAEVRRMIWAEAVRTPSETTIKGYRLCQHIDGVDIIMVKSQYHTDYTYAALLNVSKLVQTEVLQVILNNHTIQLDDLHPDASLVRESELGCEWVEERRIPPGPAGWDIILSTFRPYCHQIRTMRLFTYFDSDPLKNPENSREEMALYMAKLPELKQPRSHEQLHTCLVRQDLAGIFDNLQSLEIHIKHIAWDDHHRFMPRYVIREEVLDLFRRIKGFNLTSCNVVFDRHFGNISPEFHFWLRVAIVVGPCQASRRGSVKPSPALLEELSGLATQVLRQDNMRKGWVPEAEPEREEASEKKPSSESGREQTLDNEPQGSPTDEHSSENLSEDEGSDHESQGYFTDEYPSENLSEGGGSDDEEDMEDDQDELVQPRVPAGEPEQAAVSGSGSDAAENDGYMVDKE